ncbi:MAG: choice-of-anchor Q domain-containing protein, partial [Bythopirellula sp.]
GEDGGSGGRGGDGGGVFSSGGDLTVLSSTISGNSTGRGGNGGSGGDGADGPDGEAGGDGGNGGSGGYGGGVFSDGGNLVITNSTISGNSTGAGGLSGSGGDGGQPEATGVGGRGGHGGDGGYGGDGGGIYSSVGRLTITNSTISGNFTGLGRDGAGGGIGGLGALGGNGGDGGNGGSGGGIYSFEYPIAVTSSTITGNLANAGGSAGAAASGGFDGIAGTDGSGGGIDSLGNDPVDIDNTIIAGNLAAGTAPDMQTGSVTLNINYSLIGDGDGLNINSGTSNQIGTGLAPIDPQLGPLAHNGGTIWTHAPLPGSLAIDSGDPSILSNPAEFDQRGTPFLRVEDGDPTPGTAIDIGAYEAQAPPTADFDQDDDVDGADFLRWQRGFGITSGALLADGNSDDDEDVDASDLAVWKSTYGDGAPGVLAAQSVENRAATAIRGADIAFAALGDAEMSSRASDPSLIEAVSAAAAAREASGLPSADPLESAGSNPIGIESATPDEDRTITVELHDRLISRLF